MASLNEVRLMGNLTRDPETRYLQTGTVVCEIGVAVNKVWTDRQTGQKREDVQYFNVTFFGRTAEVCQQYLQKGSPIYIAGHLKVDSWVDKETGKNRYATKIVGDTMQMLGTRNGNGSGGQHGDGRGRYQYSDRQHEPPPDEPGNSDQYFPHESAGTDDHVPF